MASGVPAAVLRWSADFAQALILSCAIAVALSLQYFAQPFLYLNWPLDELLLGWLPILRDRLVVAAFVAAGVALAGSLPLRSAWLRSAALALAILGAALAGQLAMKSLDDFDDSPVLPFAVRWTLLSLAAAATTHLWRSSRAARDALERDSLRHVALEQQLTHTRLAALRSQIEPHFLFNSLATIRHLQGSDPRAATLLMTSFLDYLQRMLTLADRREVRLEDELALVRAYLAIMSVRMAGRLRTTIEAPADLNALAVPPLSVATLVENAIKHGLTPAPQGGRVEIRAAATTGRLELCVIDDGVGLGQGGSGSGIGLSNVRARLATLYGSEGELQVTANPEGGVRARLTLPCRPLAEAA